MCKVGEYQTAEMFREYGHLRKGLELIDYYPATGNDANRFRACFAEVTKATKGDILNLIGKDKRINAGTIAEVLKVSREWVSRNIAEMVRDGALTQTVQDIDGVEQIERERTPQADDILKKAPPERSTEILLRYSYQKRPGVDGPAVIPTTRPFCKKMMELSETGRVYTRADIEQITARLGYSVWERTGGFWRVKGTDETKIHCRHYFRTEILLKKK
jgi:DNA-binding MarR family transcriptional regulator